MYNHSTLWTSALGEDGGDEPQVVARAAAHAGEDALPGQMMYYVCVHECVCAHALKLQIYNDSTFKHTQTPGSIDNVGRTHIHTYIHTYISWQAKCKQIIDHVDDKQNIFGEANKVRRDALIGMEANLLADVLQWLRKRTNRKHVFRIENICFQFS